MYNTIDCWVRLYIKEKKSTEKKDRLHTASVIIVKWGRGTFGVVVGDEENDDAGHFLFDVLKIHHISTTNLNLCNYPAIYCLDNILIALAP